MVSTETEYLVELRVEPLGVHQNNCINFFNESWVCVRHGGDLQAHSALVEQAQRIEQNHRVRTYDCQDPSPWHLDFISQPAHDPTGRRRFPHSPNQSATTVYILDTWVDVDHPEFEGRARRGQAFATGTEQMHGTHVAGLIGGRLAGVNKRAQLVSVQVLDSQGSGSWSTILQGLEWIVTQNQPPGVINMSIGGPRSKIVNDAVNRAVSKGWRIVVAAGNERADACQTSPASASLAVTTAASTQQDQLASFSNRGSCVDIIAPGEMIFSALPGNRYGYMSGTSMASPIVAGIWSVNPEQTSDKLIRLALRQRIQDVPANQPNRFAQLFDKDASVCPVSLAVTAACPNLETFPQCPLTPAAV